MRRIFHFRYSPESSLGSPGQLGPLEQRLLEALWLRGSATVRELLAGGIKDLAYTTVMTTLDRLYKKNLLTREADSRAFRYTPRVTRQELHREVAGEAFRQLLDSSPRTELPLSYLVEILSERDTQLLEDLRQVVENKRRDLRKHDLSKNDLNKNDSRKKSTDAGSQEKM
jgi:predicted transcriptional regulator